MARMFSNLFGQSQEEDAANDESVKADPIEERFAALEKRIMALEAKVKKLEAEKVKPAEPTQTNKDNKKTVDEAKPSAEKTIPLQPAKVSYYMAAPSPDGTFGDISEREQIGKSIYQLTTADGVSGSFIMLDTHDAIATAMISVSQFVKPVCKVVGSAGSLPRHIVTDEEGIAAKEGDVWRVTRKAVVRFE